MFTSRSCSSTSIITLQKCLGLPMWPGLGCFWSLFNKPILVISCDQGVPLEQCNLRYFVKQFSCPYFAYSTIMAFCKQFLKVFWQNWWKSIPRSKAPILAQSGITASGFTRPSYVRLKASKSLSTNTFWAYPAIVAENETTFLWGTLSNISRALYMLHILYICLPTHFQ